MTCEIKDPAKANLNGSTKQYGGILQSLTLNFGDISTKHRATATFISESGEFSDPQQGDKFNIELLDQDFGEYIVESYSLSEDATSANTLQVNLVDTSHVILDHNFILLKDEFPEFQSSDFSFIGRKYGPIPIEKAVTESLAWNAHSDTKWGDLRNFYAGLGPSNIIVYPASDVNALPLTQEVIDQKVLEANGKTIYWFRNPKAPTSQKTLESALKGIIEGDLSDIADGPYDFSGTRREVIVQLCNFLGLFAYFNSTNNKVKIVANIEAEKGLSAISQLKEDCTVVNQTTSQDFSRTHAQFGMGSFSSKSEIGGSYKEAGVSRRRFFEAHKLDPTFYFVPCGLDGSSSMELDLDSFDVRAALKASVDPKVFAAYAIETIIEANTSNSELPAKEIIRKTRGKTETEEVTYTLDEALEIDEDTNFSSNDLFQEYYMNEQSEADGFCHGKGSLIPVKIKTEENETSGENANGIAGEIINQFKGEKSKGKVFDTLGKFNANKGKFEDGLMLLHKKNSLHSLMEENGSGFGADHDVLRLFLKNILLFRDRFYVLKGANYVNPAQISGRDYGYFITTELTGIPMDLQAKEGYRLDALNPTESILETNITAIKDLAMTGIMMFSKSGDLEDYKGVAVIDFIYELENNNLRDFFTNPSNYKNRHGNRNYDTDESELQMYLLIRDIAVGEFEFFENSDIQAFEEGKYMPQSEEHYVKSLFKMCSLELPREAGDFFKIDNSSTESSVESGMVTDQQFNLIGLRHLKGLEKGTVSAWLNEDRFFWSSSRDIRRSKIKVWYNVDSIGQNVSNSATGHFMIQRVGLLNEINKENIFSSSLNANISIDGADLGVDNTIFTQMSTSAAAGTLADIYSIKNRVTMTEHLEKKVKDATYLDEDPGNSTSVSILVTEDTELPTIKLEDGLESLSISAKENGELIVNMTIGNSHKLKQKEATRKLTASYKRFGHGHINMLHNSFRDFGSQSFVKRVSQI